jgi:ATP-dependent DNA ligase
MSAVQSRRDVPLPQFVSPQLSSSVERPPSGSQWVHEIKLDGYRMAARVENGRAQLLTRTGLDWTGKYPSIVKALANLSVKTAYLDGELCGVDDAGLPSFAQTQAATDGEREVRLIFYAFDLLHLAGLDVSNLPLIERKALLETLVANKPGLQFNGHDTGDGELILKHAGKLGFEGVISKTIDAPYAPGTVACGAKRKSLIGKNSSSSAGPIRKGRGLISGRCCSRTTRTTASSPTPVEWAQECPIGLLRISGAALSL